MNENSYALDANELKKDKFKKNLKQTSIAIGNIIALLPRAFVACFNKMPKMNLSDEIGKKILTEGLYHCTPSEEVSDKILESGYLKSSDWKTSYGLEAWVCMFAGVPDVENYIKNLTNSDMNKNPYLNPKMVVSAIKFKPEAKDLANYKYRMLNDEAILYKGTCVLHSGEFEKVKLVADLVRDEEGIPIKNEHGEYNVSFREAREDEVINGNVYLAKDDYLEYMAEKAKEKKFLELIPKYEKDSKLVQLLIDVQNSNINLWNCVNTAALESEIEEKFALKSTKKNFKEIISQVKGFFSNFGKTKLLNPTVQEAIDSYNLRKKNPYRDEKFAQKVASFKTQGLRQVELEDSLGEFSRSCAGDFFSEKYQSLEANAASKSIFVRGIHGKEHISRVALLAMMIANKEGVFESDNKFRAMEILSTAAMYHDIGRVFDQGPHAKRGARIVKNMDMKYLIDRKSFSDVDRRMVMALIDGHEGKPDKIKKLAEKYNIENPEDQKLLFTLNSIVRDADALDRVRIDETHSRATDYIKGFFFGKSMKRYRVNLKPDYLTTDTAKTLINSAYQLEAVSKQVSCMQVVIDYKKDERGVTEFDKAKREAGMNPQFLKSISTEKTQSISENSRETGMEPQEKEQNANNQKSQDEDEFEY